MNLKERITLGLVWIVSGLLLMTGSIALAVVGHYFMIGVAIVGFIVCILGLLLCCGYDQYNKYILIGITAAFGILYTIGFIRDAMKGYIGFAFASEILMALMYLSLGVFIFLREFKGYSPLSIRALEVLYCFIAGATIFFMLFSGAQFGYRYSKMSATDSTQIFFSLLLYGGHVVFFIANVMSHEEVDYKSKKKR